MPDYPSDDDGDALRRVASDGSDMTKPMVIDFAIAAPTEDVARQVAQLASSRGFACEVEHDVDEDGVEAWDCICRVEMVATYERLVAVQRELDELVGPLGAHTDGWGTFGNAN